MKSVIKLDTSKGNIYFCSDLHYNHSNIFKHCSSTRSRFSDLPEMNSWLRENIFECLSEDDTLIDLGDTFWKVETEEIKEILGSCKARKIKIMGNHDAYGLYYPPQKPLEEYYEIITDLLDISIRHEGKDYWLSLCHYPMVSWNHKSFGSLMIHGHCHGNIDDFNNQSPDLRVDVGCDGSLCSSLGGGLVNFTDILEHFRLKVGDLDFYKHIKKKGINL